MRVLCTDRLIKNKIMSGGTFEYAQRRIADIHEEIQNTRQARKVKR
jgi:hypothetical protein